MAKQSLANKLKAENDQLRDAARQLHAGLLEYANEKNWLIRKHEFNGDESYGLECSFCERKWAEIGRNEVCEAVWKGDGDGPKTARYFLGLDNKEDKN